MPTKHGHHRTKEWIALTRRLRPGFTRQMQAGGLPCAQTLAPTGRCQLGGVVYAHQAWDIGHIVDWGLGGTDDESNLWPAHRKCNRSDGGTAGATKTNRARARKIRGEFPAW